MVEESQGFRARTMGLCVQAPVGVGEVGAELQSRPAVQARWFSRVSTEDCHLDHENRTTNGSA
jgi:hypothetical protein